MECPRCGAATDSALECPRCGVVLAKARRPAERGSSVPASPATPRVSRRSSWPAVLPWLGVVVLVAAVAVALRPAAAPLRQSNRLEQSGPTAARLPDRDPDLPPPRQPPGVILPAPDASALADRVDAADAVEAKRLASKVRARGEMGVDDVRSAERLFESYPDPARPLAFAVLLGAAQQAHAERRDAAALALLDRALVISPGNEAGHRVLLAVQVDQADWPAVEKTASEIVRASPADSDTTCTLAYALVRQDRTREAIEILATFLDAHPDARAAALLERLRRDAAAQAPLQQHTLAHFHVRYDGDAHEDVGREVLRVLDRHYATLVSALDHQPAAPIPVTLLSRQSYYDSTGAPAWAGGHYSDFDGGVRVPIGGLTASLTPQLDGTLMHELTHAFVADCSARLAPREIHEGLAQLMEGKRVESMLGQDGLRALADGRIQGVQGYYLLALAFVEDLVAQRGQGGINDLLHAMARTRSVDDAFREVYGRNFAATQRDWATRLRQRYGS